MAAPLNRWLSLDDDDVDHVDVEARQWKQLNDKDKCSSKSEEADQ